MMDPDTIAFLRSFGQSVVDNWITLSVVGVAVFVGLGVCLERIIVYDSEAEFWTAYIGPLACLAYPVMLFLIALMYGYTPGDKTGLPDDFYGLATRDPLGLLATIAVGVAVIFSAFFSLCYSIQHNGWVIGSLTWAVFTALSLIFIFACIVIICGSNRDKEWRGDTESSKAEHPAGPPERSPGLLFHIGMCAGIFLLMKYFLVNGDAVRARREFEQEQRQLERAGGDRQGHHSASELGRGEALHPAPPACVHQEKGIVSGPRPARAQPDLPRGSAGPTGPSCCSAPWR